VSIGRLAELALAVVLLGAGIWFYARPVTGGTAGNGTRRDSQGSVLLFAVAVILGIHALGGLDYRPSQAELDGAQGQ
jgi:hypothetical protein